MNAKHKRRSDKDKSKGQEFIRRTPLVALTENQERLLKSFETNTVTFAVGPAGSGKTRLAVGAAVYAMLTGRQQRIIVTRPVVEAGEQLGALPGTADEKMHPYLRPVFDEIGNFAVSTAEVVGWRNANVLEVAPLAFMRGRTLKNAFVILDEAQNASFAQIEMFLTRLGEGSRMVITGDLSQTDLPRHKQGGLADLISALQDTDGIGIIKLEGVDVVRHPLVQIITKKIEIFKNGSLEKLPPRPL